MFPLIYSKAVRENYGVEQKEILQKLELAEATLIF